MVQIYALCVGYLELDRASMLSDLTPGTPWTVPVSSYLVVHPQGRLLFDTGVHCQSITDPIGRMGEERARRIRIRSQVGDDVVSQLARAGLQPDAITYVVNSHLHFDHCGGNEFFPHATFLVQKSEMEAARRPGGVASYSPSAIDFDHPLNYQLVDGDPDMRDWCVAMLMVIMITTLIRLDATAQDGCDTSLPALYQQVSPSVVFISAVSIASMHPGDRVGTVVGSGVLIDSAGLVLT